MAFNSEYHKLRKNRIKDEQTDSVASHKRIVPQTEGSSLFQAGAFEDGYQFGDVARTILGTVNDVSENVTTAVLDATENLIDTAAYGVGWATRLFDKSGKAQDDIGKFIGTDFLKVKESGEGINRIFNPLGTASAIINGKDTEKYSVLGDKADGLVQSGAHLIGSKALGAINPALSYISMAVNAFGSEIEQAYQNDATHAEAGISGAISAGAEILFEKLSSGIKILKGTTLDESATRWLSTNLSQKIVRTLAKMGMDLTAEGAEEVATEAASALGRKLTYADEAEWEELFSSEDAWDAFWGGVIMSGFAGGGKLVNSYRNGVDYTSGLTAGEEKVVNKLYEDAIAKEQSDGKKLSSKRKDSIYNEIVENMQKGHISTDIIEETLGGETYKAYKDAVDNEKSLKEEYDELRRMKKGEMNDIQQDRLAELKAMNLDNSTKSRQLRAKLDGEMSKFVKNSRLAESYRENVRRGQAFEADLNQYQDEYSKKTIKNIMDSKIANNTNLTHEFADMLAKMSADQKTVFDFTDNEKLKNSIFGIDGKNINGYVTKDGITINLNSPKALQTIVGHEISHVLEGTELYSSLQSELKNYLGDAKYNKRLAAIKETYKDIYKGEDADTKFEQELTADLVGDLLFTDKNFVSRLYSGNRNLFQKIFDEVKYLCRVATAGSKQARQLEKIKHTFEEVYKEGAKAQKNTATENGVRYDLSRDTVRSWDIDWDSNNNSSLKEQLRNHLSEVNSMDPVADITYNKESEKPYYVVLDDLLRENFGYQIQRKEYGTIIFDPDAISDARNYINNDAETAAILAAPYVLKRGKAISGHKNHKGKGSVTVTFAAPAMLNGQRGNVVVCVMYGKGTVHSLRVLTPEGKTFELLKIKDTETTTTGRSQKSAVDPYIVSVSNNSISNSDKNVKKKDIFGFSIDENATVNEDLLEELSVFHPEAEVDNQGNVTVYHRTNKESADKIKRSGIMTGKEDALFFSSKESGYASDYGDTVLKFKIPSTVLQVNDIFDGEVHFDIPLKYKNGTFSLDVSKYLVKDDTTQQGKASLSSKNEDIVPVKDGIYGKDIALQKTSNQDLAPVRTDIPKTAKKASDGILAPTKDDIEAMEKAKNKIVAPTREDIVSAEENNSIRTQMRSSQESINKMDPVAEIEAPKEFSNMNKAEKQNWVIEKLQPTNYQVDRKDFGIISFTKNRLKSAFNYFRKGSAEEASFEAIPYVLEKGIEISNRGEHKGRGYGTVTFAAPITINGVRGNMAVTVKRTDGNYYKVHRILTPDGSVFKLSDTTKETEPTPAGELSRSDSLAAPISSASNDSISNIAPVVNSDSKVTAPTRDDIKGSGDKVAEVLTEEPKAKKKKNRAIMQFRSSFLDKGSVFEDLSLKTKNRELMAKWNSTLSSDTKAQRLIGNGADGVKALNDIRKSVEDMGKTKEFYEYMYHLHNVDRMSLEAKESANLKRLEGEMKKLKLLHLQENQLRAIASEKITKDTSPKRVELLKTVREYLASKDIKNKPVFGSGVTAQESKSMVQQYEKQYPQFKKLSQDVYGYLNHLRKLMVDKGVISQETADLWAEMYPHYVPIRRAGDKGLNISVPLDTGRTGVNAPVKAATGGNSDILPLFDTIAQRTVQTYKAVDRNSFGIELKNTLGSSIATEAASVDDVIDSVDTHEELLQAGKNDRSPTFTVFENGKRVTFEINEDMYDALKPASSRLSGTSKILSTANNIRRGLLTEYNPTFMVTNPIKDVQDVLINSQHPARTYVSMPEAAKELWQKGGKWYKEYMENGGEQNTYFDKQSNTFDKEKSALRKALGFPLDKISEANNFIERIPRLAEYIASRKSGASIDVAMLDAARVTTNFAAGGDVTKFLNRNGFTFLNASVQGFNQQIRNIREAKRNGLKGVMALAAKVTLAGLPALLLNSLLWDDDEDYEELSDYVKDNYYIVAKYGDGNFVRIPKGRAAAVIQDAFEQVSNTLTGDDEADWQNFGELLVSNLAPNNPLDNNLIAPIVQALENKTWYGEDLVPSRLQDLPEAEQYDESTDAISKWLGETTNISPYKWNYLLDQYSGGLGDVVLPMLTPEAESGDNSFLGNVLAPMKDKFTTDSVMNNQNVSDFYDTMDELTTNAKSSAATDEDILKNKYFNSVNSDLSDLYKQKREIQNNGLPDESKYMQVRTLQKQIDEMAKKALGSYNQVSIYGDYATVADQHYKLNDEGEWKKLSDSQVKKLETFGKAVGGNAAYISYTRDLSNIKSDKDRSGNAISGSRKRKVVQYINSLDADYGEKLILYKSQYTGDDTYNYEIVEYLNSRDDLSYTEMKTILEELGFTVLSDGRVRW